MSKTGLVKQRIVVNHVCVYACAAIPLNTAMQFVTIRSRRCRFIENAAMPQACAKGCGIAAHTCCGIAASRNQLAALPRDRKYVGRVAACSGIAATHTTCTHVRGDAIFTQPQLHTKVLAIVESASQPRGRSSNIWAQSPQAFVPWILLWVGFPMKILAAMPWYVHVLVLLLVALLILLRLCHPLKPL